MIYDGCIEDFPVRPGETQQCILHNIVGCIVVKHCKCLETAIRLPCVTSSEIKQTVLCFLDLFAIECPL
jgi:hypothetical protein